MNSIQRRIAAVSDSAAHLVVQLRELDELRGQLRKALQLRKRNRKITTPRVFSKRPAKSLPPAVTGL